jgi:hypothetical protein
MLNSDAQGWEFGPKETARISLRARALGCNPGINWLEQVNASHRAFEALSDNRLVYAQRGVKRDSRAARKTARGFAIQRE